MFCILIRIVVIWANTYVKIHWAVHLRFTLYFNGRLNNKYTYTHFTKSLSIFQVLPRNNQYYQCFVWIFSRLFCVGIDKWIYMYLHGYLHVCVLFLLFYKYIVAFREYYYESFIFFLNNLDGFQDAKVFKFYAL